MSAKAIQLPDVLPRSGLLVANRKPFTVRAPRDKLVLAKLYQARVIQPDFRSLKYYRAFVDSALYVMFRTAARGEVLAKLTKNGGGYLDFVDEVKKSVTWAQEVTSSVFLDFFTAVLGARVAWNEKNGDASAKPKYSCDSARAAQALLDREPGL